ncbi:MAG: hypothetical protein PHX82_02860 [Paracoccaceae bacterium]|jgi:hypothetical protein|nr:hypothetical protein [Paracoccaceae bacterium]
MRTIVKCSAVILALAAGTAWATPSCTDWMDQGDGTSWKTCVGDDGVQRCYSVSNAAGSTAYEVSCSE